MNNIEETFKNSFDIIQKEINVVKENLIIYKTFIKKFGPKSLKNILMNNNSEVLPCDQLVFTRNKNNWTLNTNIIKKDYRMVFDKRVFDDKSLSSFPYGY